MKKGVLFVLISGLLWGSVPIFGRFLYGLGSDAGTVAAWRAYLSAAVYLIWFLFDGTFKKIRLRELPFYAVYGLFGIFGTFLFYLTAVEMLPTALAAMLLYTAPAFVILFNRLLYKEPITRTKLIALLCTLIGCCLVVRIYDLAAIKASIGGIFTGLLSGLCYSMVTVMGRRAEKLHDARTNTGLMMFFGAIAFLFIRPPWQTMPSALPQWLGYIGIALCGGVLAFLFYLRGLERLDGGIASLIATVEPISSTIFGVAIFHDVLEIWQVLGIIIVLSGIAYPFFAGRKKKGAGAQNAGAATSESNGHTDATPNLPH